MRPKPAAVRPEPAAAHHRSAAARPVAVALGGLAALATAMGVGRFVYTPILPAMRDGLGLSGGAAGAIAAANFVGYLAGALLAALPGLPGRRWTWLAGALAVSAATTAAMAAVRTAAAFALLRFLGGAASALVFVFATALVLDHLRAAGRMDLSALHYAGVGTGIAVSGGLVAGLEAAGIGWQGLWWAGAALSLALGTLGLALVPRHGTAEAGGAAAAGATPRVPLAPLVLAYGLFGFGYVVTATFLVAIVRDAPDLRAVEPLVWLCVGLSAAPSVALWRGLGHRFGPLPAFALACGVEALGVAASVLWPTAAGALAAAVLLGGTFMGLTALGLEAARRRAGGDERRTVAVMTAAFGVGQVAGPLVAGLLHDRLGSFLVPSLAAAGALVTAGAIALREVGRSGVMGSP